MSDFDEEFEVCSSVNKYLNTYTGKWLLEKYDLDEEGLWKVTGEDPNPDLGGHHHNPDLGLFEGSLKEAILWGVKQPRFWQWGAGGGFEKVKVETKKVYVSDN